MSKIYCVCPSRKIQGKKTKFEKMSRPFSKYLFLDSGFSFLIRIINQIQHDVTADHISLRCHQRLFDVPKFCWVWSSKIRASHVFFFCKSLPCSVGTINFLCARSTEEWCGAVSKWCSGAGPQTLADGQSIVAVTKDLLGYFLFVSCCLSATPFRERLQKVPQRLG